MPHGCVRYGTKQELDLKMQQFELEVMPGEAYTLSSKHEHFAGKKAMVDSDLGAADQVKKYSKPTRVVTNAAKKGVSELLKRENSAKRMSSRLKKGDDVSDVDILSSEIMKEVPVKIGDAEPKKEHSKPRKNTRYVAKNSGTRSQTGKAMVETKEVEKASLKVGEVEPVRKNSKQEKTMATKAAKETGSKSQKRGSTEDVPSQKIVSNTVSNAKTQVLQKTKKVGGQINVENRKNPIRKGQENFKTRKRSDQLLV
ncbi:hypothetical protein L1049_008319 [Liquidambar formosana]|uniref:Uncharacterized protein n=1 Tax=Liquidambar formosana TaxID=63359 RepID=A0AAP0X877_LIQFO